jgi:lysophospholipase L1-like esterase
VLRRRFPKVHSPSRITRISQLFALRRSSSSVRPDAPRRRRVTRTAVSGAMAAGLAVALLTSCTPAPPQAIASTGDSIPRGFDACTLLADCTAVSYATGSDPSSDSLYRRLLAKSPGLAGHSYNDAQVGAKASDLIPQMAAAVYQKADVATVLIGANDACADTVGDMTPVDQFQGSITQALKLFFDARPGAVVVMSSIPDLYRVWQVAHTNPRAQLVWKLAGICPSMLANPTSTAQVDNLRRVFVQLQIDKYNQTLAAVCHQFRGCRWDNGALGRYQFSADQLSRYDFFHPNATAHRVLSNLVWNAYSSS